MLESMRIHPIRVSRKAAGLEVVAVEYASGCKKRYGPIMFFNINEVEREEQQGRKRKQGVEIYEYHLESTWAAQPE